MATCRRWGVQGAGGDEEVGGHADGLEGQAWGERRGERGGDMARMGRRQQAALAVINEVWSLPPMSSRPGFVLAVDSENVAGWHSGRRVVRKSVGVQSVAVVLAEREETMTILELMWCHLSSPPIGTEWVYWIPREFNAAADLLANRAMDEQGDGIYVSTRWQRFQGRHVVGFSDAGIRRVQDGLHVGVGWMVVDRSSRECVVAAYWYRWACGGAGSWGDINVWELRAAKACLAAMVALRVGRLGEFGEIGGAAITATTRRQVKHKLFGPTN